MDNSIVNLENATQSASDDDIFYMTLETDKLIKTMYVCVGIFGIPGNVVTLIAILTSPRMRRKPFNVLIVNQSVLDMAFCLCGVLVQYIKPTFQPTLAGQLTCRIWSSMYLFWVFSFSSSYNLTAIAIERYLVISDPLHHSSYIVLKRMPLVLVMVWFTGIVVIVPEAATSYVINNTECVLYYQITFTEKVAINMFYTLMAPIIPLVIMGYSYTNIVLLLRRSSNVSLRTSSANYASSQRAQIRIIETTVFLSAIFFSCWLYLYVIQIGATFFGIPWYPQYHVAVAMVIFNSTINPYVYFIRYDEFQNRITQMFSANLCNFRLLITRVSGAGAPEVDELRI